MEQLYELKEKLTKELEGYSENGKFSKEDAEAIKYLASAIDHICNIVERDEEEYSSRGGSYDYRSYARGGNQGGGNQGGGQGGGSYRGGGYERERYSRNMGGSYARGRGRNARRDSMGRYSSEGGYSRADELEEVVESIQSMMDQLPQNLQREAQMFVQKLEQMQ